MALAYGSVKDMYDTLHDAGVTTKTLPEWSTEMNDLTGTNLYQAGVHDNWIKRASHGLDKLIEKTGLPEYGEQAGRAVGDLVGAGDAGADIGHGLPRATLNFAPLLIPGGGAVGAVAKTALTGALTGAEAYEKTDSPLSALISAGTAMALPSVAGKVSQLAGQGLGKLIGSPLVEGATSDIAGEVTGKISEYVPETLAQKIVQKGGGELAGQAAVVGVMGAAEPLEQLSRGDEVTSPFTVENALGLTLGQAPFAAIHLGKRLATRSTTPTVDELRKTLDLSNARIKLAEAKQTQENQTGVEKTPETEVKPPNPETIAATELLLSQVRGQQIDIKNRTDLTDEQKLEEQNKLMNRDYELLREKATVSGDTILGNKPLPDAPRQEVIGNQLFANRTGTYRAIHVSDDPANPEELRGKVIGYSTLHEPAPIRVSPEETVGKYSLPDAQWRKVKTLDEWNARFKRNDAGQLELPTQGEPMSVEELNSYMHDLDDVETQVDAANTTGDVQKAVVDLNAVQHANELTPTTDPKLASTTETLLDKGVKPADATKTAIKVETKRTARKITAKQNDTLIAAGYDQDTVNSMDAEQRHDAFEAIKSLKAQKKTLREQEREAPEPTKKDLGVISQKMEGGFQIQTADKLSHREPNEEPVQEVRDMVTDTAMTAGASPAAQEAFNTWEGREDTSYHKDFRDFTDLMENYGSIKNVPLEEAGKLLAERSGTVPWDAAEVQEFIDRPHVQEWAKEVDRQLGERQKNNMSPAPLPHRERTYIDKDGIERYERLVRPAVQEPNGKVTVGLFHEDARENASSPERSLPGWVTDTGRFLTMEAAEQEFPTEFDHDPTGFTHGTSDNWVGAENAEPLTDAEVEGKTTWTPDHMGGISPAPIPAGDKFVYSLADYNPETNTLNEKHRLPKNGQVVTEAFRAMAGVGKPLQQAEVDFYKQIVPEAFKGAMVDVPKLYEGLKTKGPQVETKILGTKANDADARAAEARHRLETLWPNYREVRDNILQGRRSAEVPDLEQQLRRAAPTPAAADSLREALNARIDADLGTATDYHYIAPKPESEMPGYVEGLVRLPAKGDIRAGTVEAAQVRSNELYRGPHFGSEDTNVLAFYRGYEETLPSGEKAFHVIEVQSDWAQSVRDRKSGEVIGRYDQNAPDGIDRSPQPDHPLLKLYETLALKAAISHAREVGATRLILSDAETAMMTEGHDQSPTRNTSKSFTTREEAEQFVKDHPEWRNPKIHLSSQLSGGKWVLNAENVVSQEKGMRLHYDKSMPSILEKLTGSKGEETDLGTHKAVRFDDSAAPEGSTPIGGGDYVKGSPVFKDANGNPKTQITGRSYDISNVPGEFTLTEPTRAPIGHGITQAEPVFEPTEPRDVETIKQMGLAQGGQGILNFLAQSKNPFFAGLAKDLAKFGDSLSRVSANVREINHGGYIKQLGGHQFEIVISPGYLRSDAFEQEFVLAHELVHGLTLAELQRPTNSVYRQQLDSLRETVASRLPKNMRAAYKNAMATGWYDKWNRSQVDYEELMPNGSPTERNILYGLVNLDEFVAQGLSERPFREFLQKIDTKQSWFHTFANTVKGMLGLGEKVTNTAFEQFLSHTSGLLQRGDYVASFKNFSDRYFENLGMGKRFVDENTRRATALVLSDLITPDEVLVNIRRGAGVIRSPDWLKAQKDLTTMYSEGGDDLAVTQRVLDESGYKTTVSGLLDLADSLMLGESSHDILDLLPEPAIRHVLETAKDAQNILGAVRTATLEHNKGVLNLSRPLTVGRIVRETLVGVEKLVAQDTLHDQQIRDIQNLFNVPPDGFYSNITRSPEVLPEWAHGDTKKSWFDTVARFLEPQGQLALRIPEAAEPLTKGFQLRANVRNMARESLKALGIDLTTMKITKDTVKGMFKVFSNPSLRKAADRWIAENNIEGEKNKTGVSVIDADDARVQKIIGSLSQGDREIVEDMVNKHSISTQHMQDQILEKSLQIGSTDGGALIQKLVGGKLKDAVETAGTLLNSFTADRSDPNAASIANAQIQKIQAGLDPDTFLTVARFTKAVADRWTSMKEGFDANPGWSSAQRFGKYLVEYRKGGKSMLDAVDSKKEAEALTGGRPYKLRPNKQNDEDRPPSLGFDSQAIADRIRKYDQNMVDILQNTGTYTPDQIAQIKQYSGGEQFITEEAYRGGVQGINPQPRRLTKGAEDLPWMRNHVSWVHQTANAWSRQLLKAQARAHLSDPEISSNEELHSNLKTHYENMLQPDTAFGRFFQRAAMTWYMGFNPASALINGTQPFLTHVAEFTNMTGKPLDSYRRVLSALRETYASGLGHGEWKDPETAKFMKRFVQEGEADISKFDDEAAGNELLHTNLVRMLNGDKPQTLGQKLSTVSGNISNMSMLLFKTVERINAMSAGISAYKYYRETQPNLGFDEAYAKAVQFHHGVNYGGGSAGRPTGAFAGRGPFPRTVAMLATAMQSYNLGTTFQIARYIRSGFFRPAGLTPAEVHSARTAAVQMLGTQLAAAGVLGLPFVSGMLSVLNQAFPGLEVNRKLRETMNTIFGEDDNNGHVLTDISMTGAPSMLGWDVQSRLSMGNTVPGVSEINGFQPENLLGAPANLVSSFIGGGAKLASGDPHAIDAFMPSALKKIEQLLRSGGQVLDYRNRPIFTPTLGEKVGIALGFNPKRLSDFNNASRIAAQTDDNIKRREGQFHQMMGQEVLRGNFGSVRQALQQRIREDKTYDPMQAVRSISSAAEELTFPRDLRREGTARSGDVQGKLLATFNLPPGQPSEVDRARFRQSVQQRLGLASTSPTDLSTAQVVDQLRQSNPTASRSELRQQASLLLHGRRRTSFSLPTE